MQTNAKFYHKLPAHKLSPSEMLGAPGLFKAVPSDWHVVVVDIEGSTQAVERGQHHDVNLAATGSIITVLNGIKAKHGKLRIPFFFGGDGAAFIVPDDLVAETRDALTNYSRHVRKNFELVLRVGTIAVHDIYQQDVQLYIAKLKLNPYLTIPVILGNGVVYAEALIKAAYRRAERADPTLPLDLEGMECRWNEIAPPVENERIVCLLVQCREEALQAPVYQALINEIDRLFGDLQARQPISPQRLRLNLTLAKIRTEMYGRLGEYSFFYLVRNWLATVIGQYYFKVFKEGQDYLRKISQLSTTLMLDGNFHSVISGTEAEIAALKIYLETQEQAGLLTYGIHVTHSSIMSCYIEDRKRNHIHFVDGTEGGYTTAARMFKAKLVV